MEKTENREIQIICTCNAPIGLMWKVWTDPEHLVHWWAPNGFTSTIHKMHFQEGGEWKLTLHGPDGTNLSKQEYFQGNYSV